MGELDDLYRFHTEEELLSYRSALRAIRREKYTMEELRQELDDRVYVAALRCHGVQGETVYVDERRIDNLLDRLSEQSDERERYDRWLEKDPGQQNRLYRRGYETTTELPQTVEELRQLKKEAEEDVVEYAVNGHMVGVVGAAGLFIATAATGVTGLAAGAVGAFGVGVGGGAAKAMEHSGRKRRITEELDDAVRDRYGQRPSKHEFLAEQILAGVEDHSVAATDLNYRQSLTP